MIKKVFKFLLVPVLIVILLHIPLTTRQGINGKVRTFQMPLYIKVIEFLDRNYQYGVLSRQITEGCVTDEEKVMTIFNWVRKNIHAPPKDFTIIDDHVLNIIIRQYGTGDQMADVFTTLCVYSGVPAFWRFESLPDDTWNFTTISYVLLNDKWRVFDVYRNIIFLNDNGEMTSVEDIISDISIVKRKNIRVKDRLYEDFFKGLKPIKKNFISKEQQQIPLYRIIYEVRRIFGR